MRLYSGPPPRVLIGFNPGSLDPSRAELAALKDELQRALLDTDQAARAGLSLIEMMASIKAGYEKRIAALEVGYQVLSIQAIAN